VRGGLRQEGYKLKAERPKLYAFSLYLSPQKKIKFGKVNAIPLSLEQNLVAIPLIITSHTGFDL
jgi:hypothetical protein